jgi:dihydrodipicolinate synthase/N-acetylneuraminate lyase
MPEPVTSPVSPVEERAALQKTLLPEGIPHLWCPPITHYDDEGRIDRIRTAAHWREITRHAGGLLIPGSTGDGWEMTEGEVHEIVELALSEAARLGFRVLIGTLKTDAGEARQAILATATRLGGGNAPADARRLAEARVCGFTVCPPKGGSLTQQEIETALASILETGLPLSLYQLPQVTGNEMSPATVAGLATRFHNFILFKDTSGADRVALSGQNFGGVYLVRGAESGYAQWLKGGGGPYPGFLLSTANCFANELARVIAHSQSGEIEAARGLSDRLSGTVKDLFAVVGGLPHGNAFANANKAADHFFSHGPRAISVPPPRLHAGVRLPVEVIRAVGELLNKHGFMPTKGYLE